MALTTDHGIVERMSTWAYAPATGPTPFVINDHAATAWIILKGAPGLHDGPEADDNREPRTTIDGEITYPGLKLGRTFTLKCELYAETDSELYIMMTSLRRGYTFDTSLEGAFTITPYSDIGGPVWNFSARCIGFHPAEEWTWVRNRKWKFRWELDIVMRMSNPNFYSSAVSYV